MKHELPIIGTSTNVTIQGEKITIMKHKDQIKYNNRINESFTIAVLNQHKVDCSAMIHVEHTYTLIRLLNERMHKIYKSMTHWVSQHVHKMSSTSHKH